ncbi:MAG: terpene cyclase/mutase family protein [Gemmatimonadetes bacterium]|nr:terpene cyclase/mutase family protein [Gemmatimonadota bacterium]
MTGWSSSYPETTGYIVPTILGAGDRFADSNLTARGRRMLDWLVSIQLEDGGFQGGMIDQTPVVPVTFNTGQILMGLADGARRFGEPFRNPMRAAADWLTRTQDPDGCWRSHPTPFAEPGEKAYETHVAWGLMEAVRTEHRDDWQAAALRNVDWALTLQSENGWFARCCLNDPDYPLTHTLGYALRGIVEAWRLSREQRYLEAAVITADGLLSAQRPDGSLPGRLGPDWAPRVSWSCLTGNAQIAACWLMLYADTGNRMYAESALLTNAFLRRTICLEGPDESRGGVKGSYPVWGDYGRFQYLNWAAKFAIDSFLLEIDANI